MEQMPLAGLEHSYFATVKLKLVIANLGQLHVVANRSTKKQTSNIKTNLNLLDGDTCIK